MAGQCHRPGEGEVSPDRSRNKRCPSSHERLDQQGNRQRNGTGRTDRQGISQAHFGKNQHHHTHQAPHAAGRLRIMPGTSTPLTTGGCPCYYQSASRASGIGINRSRAIDNDSKSFALGVLDLCANQAGGNAAQIRLVFGAPLRKWPMPPMFS